MRFRDFEDTARDLFGLEPGEVRDLADALDAAGFDYKQWDADEPLVWEIAADILDFDAMVEDMPHEPYDMPRRERWALDPSFIGDEYLDAGVEWELTAESEGTP